MQSLINLEGSLLWPALDVQPESGFAARERYQAAVVRGNDEEKMNPERGIALSLHTEFYHQMCMTTLVPFG